MVPEGIQWLGLVTVTVAAVGAYALRAPRARAAAMLLALGLTPVLVAGDLWHATEIQALRDEPAKLVALAALGAAVVGGLTALFIRRPVALPLAAVAMLPFRIPFGAGGSTANLLIPLYAVIAAGVLARAHQLWRQPPRQDPQPSAPDYLGWAIAGVVILYALQSVYSDDFSKALQNLGFFLVPFTLLFGLLRELEWDRRLLLYAGLIVATEALLMVLIGFWEYAARDLLWNDQVIRSNAFQRFFRVNSLFWDPNVFGRYLAVVILGAVATVLWARAARTAAVAAGLAVLLWAGLAITFSQSSLIALLVGLAILAALRWHLRWTAAVVAAAGLAAFLFLVVAGGTLKLNVHSGASINRHTSGRASLISGGLELASDRPLWGYGSGSFARSFREQHRGHGKVRVAASHTEPVTIAAEQGALGILAYLALLAAATMTMLRRLGEVAPGIRRPWRGWRELSEPELDGSRTLAVARVGIVAAFAALLVHTMTYASFLPDPLTWVLLALAAALTPRPIRQPA